MHMTTKKMLLSAVCSFFFLFSLMGQEKQLTLHDLIPGGKTQARFIPSDLKQLQWCGDHYLYVRGDSVITGAPGGKETVAFTRKTLNEVLAANALDSLGKLPFFSIPYKDRPIVAFYLKKHRIHYAYAENRIVATYRPEREWVNQAFCVENGYVAFTEGNNVRLLSPENEQTEVTAETEEGIVCGTSVHQNEFGIHKGLFWSPKGSALAFYRMDERMVTAYPLVDISTRSATLLPHKYPMAGMKSHEVTVGVYHLSSGRTVWLKTGLPKEKYLTNVAWSPDEKSIYIAELNREQNEMNLVRYSAITGEKELVLFTETDERYVEPQHPVQFLPNDPDKFIWQSRRDGYNHLYLYNTDGKLLKQLTAGKWMVLEVLGFDRKSENLFISSTQPLPEDVSEEGSPLSIHTWKLQLKSGKLFCLSTDRGQGVHSSSLSFSGRFLLDRYASPSVPREIRVVDTEKGKIVQTLLTAKDPFRNYRIPEVVTGTIKAADGVTDLNYRLVKPLDLDETIAYPTIVYVYGGPHAQLVTGGWKNGVGGWDLYMAQRGYVMFTLDSRGSANRGHAFESVIHRNLGVNEMADQLKGVEFLKSLPYVDADRIGVHGWSYGGFMTTNLMCSYPDVFKVGVAGGPVIDWKNYEIMYGERYMDRPQDNPDGYKNANLKEKAGRLKGHLLLIHGDVDPVVVWQHSLGFLKACVDAGTYPDYFVYPGHPHNVIGKDRPHLYEKITRYFDDYLKK